MGAHARHRVSRSDSTWPRPSSATTDARRFFVVDGGMSSTKSSFCGDGAAGGATGDGAAGVGGGGFSGDGDVSGAAPFVASASAFGAASESTDSEASSRVFASAWDASSSAVKMFDAPQLPRGRPGEKSGKGSMFSVARVAGSARRARRRRCSRSRRRRE